MEKSTNKVKRTERIVASYDPGIFVTRLKNSATIQGSYCQHGEMFHDVTEYQFFIEKGYYHGDEKYGQQLIYPNDSY